MEDSCITHNYSKIEDAGQLNLVQTGNRDASTLNSERFSSAGKDSFTVVKLVKTESL